MDVTFLSFMALDAGRNQLFAERLLGDKCFSLCDSRLEILSETLDTPQCNSRS